MECKKVDFSEFKINSASQFKRIFRISKSIDLLLVPLLASEWLALRTRPLKESCHSFIEINLVDHAVEVEITTTPAS